MRMDLLLGAALVLLAVKPQALPAQDRVPASTLDSIDAGTAVRLEVAGLGRVEGRVLGWTSGRLVLGRRRDGVVELQRAEIDRLWIRERATRKGAVIGAVGGAVLGIVGGYLTARVACEPIDGGDCTAAEVATVMGLVGGAGGAILGAGVGLAIPIWRLKFSRGN